MSRMFLLRGEKRWPRLEMNYLGPGSLRGPTAGWAVKVGGDSKGNCGVFEISLVAGVPRGVGHLG